MSCFFGGGWGETNRNHLLLGLRTTILRQTCAKAWVKARTSRMRVSWNRDVSRLPSLLEAHRRGFERPSSWRRHPEKSSEVQNQSDWKIFGRVFSEETVVCFFHSCLRLRARFVPVGLCHVLLLCGSSGYARLTQLHDLREEQLKGLLSHRPSKKTNKKAPGGILNSLEPLRARNFRPKLRTPELVWEETP